MFARQPRRRRREPGVGTRSALLVSLTTLLIVYGCSAPPPATPANVLLISIDTLRPDRLSCYGAERPTSPAIDALAARGVRFTEAFTTSPWTLPAHASMLTGRYPSSLLAAGADPDHLYRGGTSLATLLRGNGYATGAVTGGGFVAETFGAAEGFDDFEAAGVRQALRWLDANAAPPDAEGSRPFFFFFHTYAPHVPYQDRRFVEEGDGGRFAELYRQPDGGWWPLHLEVCCDALPTSAEERRYFRDLYDGGVARADAMVARLLAKLVQLGIADSTLVIVTSDHGEEFWEHTGRGAYHGHTVYDELARIPLIWFDPQLGHAPRTVDTPVSLVDLMPTLARRLGAELAGDVDGSDLGPLLSGKRAGLRRPIFIEANKHGPPRLAVRTREAKLIWTPDPDLQADEGASYPVPVAAPLELFLPEDRGERRNVAGEHSDVTAGLRSLLERHRDRGGSVASPSQGTDSWEALDQATREELRSLGYL